MLLKCYFFGSEEVSLPEDPAESNKFTKYYK